MNNRKDFFFNFIKYKQFTVCLVYTYTFHKLINFVKIILVLISQNSYESNGKRYYAIDHIVYERK